jgi:hypothetical protein
MAARSIHSLDAAQRAGIGTSPTPDRLLGMKFPKGQKESKSFRLNAEMLVL